MPENLEDRLLLETARFRVVERAQPTPPGQPRVARQVVLHPGAAVILPILDDGRICLIRNLRVAVEKTLIELPAGTLDPGEAPLVTAQRELQEETGYTAAKWQELPGFFMSPGILNERMHVFVAEGLSAGDPAREAGEQIENLLLPAEEAIAMAQRGEIEDAKTLATLLMWNLSRTP
ncbi:NUDIX hydrolase [Adhaeretor mobilis]|uniref:GDP-mannose pyrophosphatase n=1 Tax=Adhaeretor mobilis TaxID=1930276 RepID=A0A517MSP9_9BACT|nr:NUDIX hydrolase [Adhaeretor mobilis]QDS97911.1 ADP-ribose pyrophosphatase [Adhaeretor mobilis]